MCFLSTFLIVYINPLGRAKLGVKMYVFDIKEFNTALENFQKCVFLPIFATVTLSDHLKESTSDNLPSFTVYIERKNVDTFTAVCVYVCVQM